ncbi:DUF4189 domain-containing protein [Frateuria defendens]|uniref:DUF4189 domain-containing protein n=1 Tax=Frateuria defendens TaxID=2219559 RepID=UPI003CCCFF29
MFCAPEAWSQCAPGIPGAGNPACIPPNQVNSPYYQGAGVAQPHALWEDRWGAIAIDSETGDAGTVEGQSSKSIADSAALSYCSKGKGENCKVILSFHNQCAAVAWGAGVLGYSGGATPDVAEEMAMKGCGYSDDCKIVYSKCSYAERVR